MATDVTDPEIVVLLEEAKRIDAEISKPGATYQSARLYVEKGQAAVSRVNGKATPDLLKVHGTISGKLSTLRMEHANTEIPKLFLSLDDVVYNLGPRLSIGDIREGAYFTFPYESLDVSVMVQRMPPPNEGQRAPVYLTMVYIDFLKSVGNAIRDTRKMDWTALPLSTKLSDGTFDKTPLVYDGKDEFLKTIEALPTLDEQGKLNRDKTCPKCGSHVFLGKHKGRLYCGNCHYTEFSK